MPPALSTEGLGLGESRLVVGQGMTPQQGAQLLGVGRVTQPDQGLGVQLAHPFAAETQREADLAEGGRRIAAQAVVGHDDGA